MKISHPLTLLRYYINRKKGIFDIVIAAVSVVIIYPIWLLQQVRRQKIIRQLCISRIEAKIAAEHIRVATERLIQVLEKIAEKMERSEKKLKKEIE